jgi:hypothetical protein
MGAKKSAISESLLERGWLKVKNIKSICAMYYPTPPDLFCEDCASSNPDALTRQVFIFLKRTFDPRQEYYCARCGHPIKITEYDE